MAGLARVGGDVLAPAVVTIGTVTPLDPQTTKYHALLHTTTAPQTVTGKCTLWLLATGFHKH